MTEVENQLLEVTPNRVLVFHGSFTHGGKASIELRNPTRDTIEFSVRATVPQYYTGSRSAGILKPGETKTVSVKIKPTGITPWDAASHKFVVESCVTAWYDWILFKAGLDWKKYAYTDLIVKFAEGPKKSDEPFSTWKEDDQCAQIGESVEVLN